MQQTSSGTKHRVLFVDDEPSLLSALRRMLRPQRHRWAMTFVEGGEGALQVLQREPFDVVISDMRMPGIDGTALRREVHRLYPHIYRVVLSGYAEPEAASRVTEIAHCLLTKPCDPEVLIEAIERGCRAPRSFYPVGLL